MIKFKTF